MSPFAAEFLGTMLLILMGGGVVANAILTGTKGNGGGWIVITVGWALGVFIGVTVAAPFSGAHLNPAVTLALALNGSFPWANVGMFVLAQLLGAMLGAGLVWLFYRDHFAATADKDAKLAVFCTAPAIRTLSTSFLCEAVGTFVLVYAILHVASPVLDGPNGDAVMVGMGSLGAIPVTLIVLAIGLSLGGPTGYAINPARDLGPRIMHALLPIPAKRNSDWTYAWVPVVAPLVGSAIAVLLTGIFG
ncbi:MAG: aquaporin family protein [Flavobacteriales bacterium]|nr:aquaporin family protein [Flavobacteriales bacterium]